MTLVLSQTDFDRETRDGDIVRLRLDGPTYRETSSQVGLSISQCQRVVEAARARRRGDYDLDKHHRDVLNDIENTLDVLRPWIMGEPVPDDVLPPPTRDLFAQWWKFLKAKREFLALDAPKRTHAVTQGVEPEPVNQHAAEYLARLAIWARETNTINVDGYNPALPPGMTERPRDASAMNGQGKGMWSMVVEYPSED